VKGFTNRTWAAWLTVVVPLQVPAVRWRRGADERPARRSGRGAGDAHAAVAGHTPVGAGRRV
jgi:hypothetical protein